MVWRCFQCGDSYDDRPAFCAGCGQTGSVYQLGRRARAEIDGALEIASAVRRSRAAQFDRRAGEPGQSRRAARRVSRRHGRGSGARGARWPSGLGQELAGHAHPRRHPRPGDARLRRGGPRPIARAAPRAARGSTRRLRGHRVGRRRSGRCGAAPAPMRCRRDRSPSARSTSAARSPGPTSCSTRPTWRLMSRIYRRGS